MNEKKFIRKENFLCLLKRLSSEYKIFVPQGEEDFFYHEFKDEFQFNPYRTISSLRQFYFPSLQIVSFYFEEKEKKRKPFCIVGVKACDLYSLKIHDYVFLDEKYPDEEYKYFRENNLIISGDCTEFKSTCFCLYLGIEAYPQENFDLNLSPLKDGFLVEIGSEKGKRIVEKNNEFFEEKENLIEDQKKLRDAFRVKLKEYLDSLNLPPKEGLYSLIKENHASGIWEDFSLHCVECGACIMNCPTCHCFLLFDEKKEDKFIRGRTWDGCQFKNFSRVAAGANPLRLRKDRLRNRYIKKFEFFYEILGIYACCGCGRCIESCIGKIDLREIFKSLAGQIKMAT